MIAEIASGEVDTADLFFLFAVILAAVATVLCAVTSAITRWAPVALSAAVAFASAGWLVL
jgi:hypothetical protein